VRTPCRGGGGSLLRSVRTLSQGRGEQTGGCRHRAAGCGGATAGLQCLDSTEVVPGQWGNPTPSAVVLRCCSQGSAGQGEACHAPRGQRSCTHAAEGTCRVGTVSARRRAWAPRRGCSSVAMSGARKWSWEEECPLRSASGYSTTPEVPLLRLLKWGGGVRTG
jgi:hypothetical protein